MKQGLDSAISIFDQYKEEVLTFTVHLGQKDEKLYLLRELMFDDHDLVDYEKLMQRMRKLPAVTSFYATLRHSAKRALALAEEQFDLWYTKTSRELSSDVQKVMAEDKTMPASMKKALTIDQLRGMVMEKNPTLWREKRALVEAQEDRVALLSTLLDGLDKSSRLLFSESRLLETLLNHGIETVNSSPRASLNRYQDRSPGPENSPDEDTF